MAFSYQTPTPPSRIWRGSSGGRVASRSIYYPSGQLSRLIAAPLIMKEITHPELLPKPEPMFVVLAE